MKKYSNYLITVVLAAILLLVSLKLESIKDWWFLRNYEPSNEITLLVRDSDMSDRGRDLFFVSDPMINTAEDFNANCPDRERSFVLGCYSARKIFLFGVDDARLEGVEEVTAAHEMLHAAYDRLNSAQKDKIAGLLDRQFDLVKNQRVLDLIETYRQQDSGSIYNEMHSIFGTELRDLIPELNEHYRQYFDQRLVVVELSEAYEAVFIKLEAQADNLKSSIDSLRSTIDSSESSLLSLKDKIDTGQAQLDQYKQQIDQARADQNAQLESQLVEEHNSLLESLQEEIDLFNSLLVTQNQAVSQHNSKVNQFNAIVGQQNELIQNLDSNFESL